MNDHGFAKGDAVSVSHDLGIERGHVLSVIDDRVKVRFSDGTVSSWGCDVVSRVVSVYLDAIDEQIDALNRATGLIWELLHTGGGHDALVAYFKNWVDEGDKFERSYLMLTCDASVVVIGEDRYAMLGFYLDDDTCEADLDAYLNDESAPLLTMTELVDFVAETLKGWGFI
jgi:hypothetical protein